MLPTLPTEMVDHIAGFMPTHALLGLAGTSRFLYEVAIRKLYGHIFLDDFNILPFLRTMMTLPSTTVFHARCRLVTGLHVAVRDPVFIAKANPYICTIIRYMPNLQSFTFLGNHFSGSMMYMFMSRSAILIRRAPCKIPALAPISHTEELSESENLPGLKHLCIGGDISLVQLAFGRLVESIVVSRALYLRPATLLAFINHISGAGVPYPSLRSFCFCLVAECEGDVMATIQIILSKFDCLEELDITVLSPAPAFVMNSAAPALNINQRWPLQLLISGLLKFRLRGNTSRLVVSSSPFERGCSGSESLAQDFQEVMPCLTELLIGRHAWKRVEKTWQYEFVHRLSDGNVSGDFDFRSDNYRLWRLINTVDECMFETDEGDESELRQKCRRWMRRGRDWELRADNGEYFNTSFTVGTQGLASDG